MAAILNAGFVAVKVDREERPDIDHIYMEVCQRLTGSGGWPLTVLLTPGKKPFFAGTYFPKASRHGRPGLIDLLQKVATLWRTDRSRLTGYGAAAARSLQREAAAPAGGGLGAEQLDQAYGFLQQHFDAAFGGFGTAPKFPSPHTIVFLLYYWRRTGTPAALAMARQTLDAMRRGGIYDHLGFGFCRYSTDKLWLVPHFEKMLYDNALLCYAYLEAFQASGDAGYAQVAAEIIDYVLRDMSSPDGAFYSAEDADSEGEEGLFYLWTRDEITDALGRERGHIFADYYHVSDTGNFERGRSILHLIGRDPEQFAGQAGLTPQALAALLAESRSRLFSLRAQRVRPFRDDKILTAWNALMIAALAKAAKVLQRPDYLRAAESALAFIEAKLMRDDGRLLARFRQGEAAFLAYLDDYAFLLWAVLELYEATFAIPYLQKAAMLAGEMQTLFADPRGGFFFTAADAESLLVRPKELYDGAMPSGNSVAVFALLKLSRLNGDASLLAAVEQAITVFAGEVRQRPDAYLFLLLAVDLYLSPAALVIAGRRGDRHTEAMLDWVRRSYLPQLTLLFRDTAIAAEPFASIASFSGKEPVRGQATAYICDDRQCHAPITDLARFKQLVAKFIN